MLLKFILFFVFIGLVGSKNAKERQKRYLVFTPFTQFGAFVTISIPLPEPNNLVNLAWFFEANYYTIDNATWYEPLLGDVEVSKSRLRRTAAKKFNKIISRSLVYESIESMLKKYGYIGRPCLLRSICEASTSHFSHNGVIGDMLHLILTPSSSEEEDLEDFYYEAEYRGLDGKCKKYQNKCPTDPLEDISIVTDHLLLST